MNYKDINYETVEERNLRKMKIKRKNNCQHSYRVSRKFQNKMVSSEFLSDWDWAGRIHIKCEKCGKTKKMYVNSATMAFYNKGDKWKGKIK